MIKKIKPEQLYSGIKLAPEINWSNNLKPIKKRFCGHLLAMYLLFYVIKWNLSNIHVEKDIRWCQNDKFTS